MKKVLVASIIFALLLTGCTINDSYVQASPSVTSVQLEYSDFDLIVDGKTNIVYIDNIVKYYDDGFAKISHIYTPYYGKNGKLCKFVDGKVVEIE